MKQRNFIRAGLALLVGAAVLVPVTLFSQGASPVGLWAAVGDKGENKGKVTSHIRISERSNGTLTGAIIKPITDPDAKCSADCPGPLANQPLRGLTIMWGFKKTGANTWGGGKIVDPEDGSVYSCNLTLEGNRLIVRSYIGFSALGRTQTWRRVQ